ncbi:MAG: hypothetical protein WB424_00010 [Terracidiphilus sp.]
MAGIAHLEQLYRLKDERDREAQKQLWSAELLAGIQCEMSVTMAAAERAMRWRSRWVGTVRLLKRIGLIAWILVALFGWWMVIAETTMAFKDWFELSVR